MIEAPLRALHTYLATKQNEPRQDRAARLTANATITIAAFTAVAAGIGAAQWWILSGQLAELQAERRAWLEVKDVAVTQIYIRQDEVSVFADITYANIGKTPADHILAKPGLTKLYGMAAKDAQSACDGVTVERKPGFGPTVFPNGSNIDHVNFIDKGITKERNDYIDEVIRNARAQGYTSSDRNSYATGARFVVYAEEEPTG